MNRYETRVIDVPLVALVGAMGIGRIADRGHWLSDQVLGIAMGWAIGKEVARRQLRRLADQRGAAQAGAPRSSALVGPSDGGILIGWQVAF